MIQRQIISAVFVLVFTVNPLFCAEKPKPPHLPSVLPPAVPRPEFDHRLLANIKHRLQRQTNRSPLRMPQCQRNRDPGTAAQRWSMAVQIRLVGWARRWVVMDIRPFDLWAHTAWWANRRSPTADVVPGATSAGAGGAGEIVFIFDRNETRLKVGDEHQNIGATFNRFGLFNMQWANSKWCDIYLDDLTYTVSSN